MPAESLVRLEVDHRVSGIERLVFRSEFFEPLEEITIGHAQIVFLKPGDHSRELPPLSHAFIGDIDRRLIVRHQDSAEVGRFLEVKVIGSSLRVGVDGTDHIPATSDETLDEASSNVGVGVDRETSHA